MDKFTQAYAKIINVLNSKARKTVSESVEAPDAATEAVLKANGFTAGRTLYDYGSGKNVTGWTKPLQDGKSLFIGYDNVDGCVKAYITDIIDANDANEDKHHKCLVGKRDYSGSFNSYEDAISELGSITGEDAWSVYDSDLTDWFQEDDDADWNLSEDDYVKAYQIFADMAKQLDKGGVVGECGDGEPAECNGGECGKPKPGAVRPRVRRR